MGFRPVGKSAEDEAARLKYHLCALIGSSDGIESCASWKSTKSGGVDWKGLAEATGVATTENIQKFTREGHRMFRLLLK